MAEDETDLRLFPPLRASWSLRGQSHPVELSGSNEKRVLFGALNIRTGHRLSLIRRFQRGADFQAFLELVSQSYRAWKVTMLLDEDSSHTAGTSQTLAAQSGIRLKWLPKRSPHLNPMDHLWRHVKGVAAANRQEPSIDALVDHVLAYLHSLTASETLRKAALHSPDFWLHRIVSKNF